MDNSEKFWEKWVGKSVRIAKGPFVGACGTAQGTTKDRVQVALAEPPVKVLWFCASDLAIEETLTNQ